MGGERAKTQISWSEIKLFLVSGIVGDMHLAIDAGNRAVGIDNCGGVVINTGRPAFENRRDDHGFRLMRHAAQRLRGWPGHRFRQFKILRIFALAEVLRAKKFRQTEDLSSGAGSFFNPRHGVREIFLRLGADCHLHQTNCEFIRRCHDRKIYTKSRYKAIRRKQLWISHSGNLRSYKTGDSDVRFPRGPGCSYSRYLPPFLEVEKEIRQKEELLFFLFRVQQFLILIFFPGKKYQQQVEESKNNESHRMRMSESINLVDDKNCENGDCQRVGPQLIHPEANDQHGLNQSMRQEIKRGEHRAAASQFLRSNAQVRENIIVFVPREFVLAKRLQPGVQRVDFKPQQHAAKRFEYSVDPFYGDAYPERIVKQNMG